MTPIENIKFSFPCKEDFNKMTSCSLGRYCASCNKTVVDFRNQDLTELIKSIEKNETICGIFSKSQVQQTNSNNYLKRIAASVLITIGLSAFNKNLFAQAKTTDSLTQSHNTKEEEVFFGTVVETMPTYKNGGEKELLDFLAKNIQYPKDSVQGIVVVRFTIDTLGKPTNIKVLKSLNEPVDKEAIRVTKLLEFIPGTMRGKKVPVNFTLPISFNFKKR